MSRDPKKYIQHQPSKNTTSSFYSGPPATSSSNTRSTTSKNQRQIPPLISEDVAQVHVSSFRQSGPNATKAIASKKMTMGSEAQFCVRI